MNDSGDGLAVPPPLTHHGDSSYSGTLTLTVTGTPKAGPAPSLKTVTETRSLRAAVRAHAGL